jgi:hypothetical protein
MAPPYKRSSSDF